MNNRVGFVNVNVNLYSALSHSVSNALNFIEQFIQILSSKHFVFTFRLGL